MIRAFSTHSCCFVNGLLWASRSAITEAFYFVAASFIFWWEHIFTTRFTNAICVDNIVRSAPIFKIYACSRSCFIRKPVILSLTTNTIPFLIYNIVRWTSSRLAGFLRWFRELVLGTWLTLSLQGNSRVCCTAFDFFAFSSLNVREIEHWFWTFNAFTFITTILTFYAIGLDAFSRLLIRSGIG